MSLGEIIADISKDTDNLRRNVGAAGSITYFVDLYQEVLTTTAPYTIESTRTLGSSFILDHGSWGMLGSGHDMAKSGFQPYLGDSRSSWSNLRILSPNNKFVETFDGSRFIKW